MHGFCGTGFDRRFSDLVHPFYRRVGGNMLFGLFVGSSLRMCGIRHFAVKRIHRFIQGGLLLQVGTADPRHGIFCLRPCFRFPE